MTPRRCLNTSPSALVPFHLVYLVSLVPVHPIYLEPLHPVYLLPFHPVYLVSLVPFHLVYLVSFPRTHGLRRTRLPLIPQLSPAPCSPTWVAA